jgi:hypothetical protein
MKLSPENLPEKLPKKLPKNCWTSADEVTLYQQLCARSSSTTTKAQQRKEAENVWQQ